MYQLQHCSHLSNSHETQTANPQGREYDSKLFQSLSKECNEFLKGMTKTESDPLSITWISEEKLTATSEHSIELLEPTEEHSEPLTIDLGLQEGNRVNQESSSHPEVKVSGATDLKKKSVDIRVDLIRKSVNRALKRYLTMEFKKRYSTEGLKFWMR